MKGSLCKFIYLLILPTLSVTIILTFLKPANNLIIYPMIICSIISVFLIFYGGYLWVKIYSRIQKYEPYIYYITLFLWIVLVYFVSAPRGINGNNTLTDYSVVYYAANEYADNKTIESSYIYNYFLHYNNNLRPMLLLSWLFKLASLLHISRFHFVLFLVCIQIFLTAWSIGILCTDQNDKTWRFPSAILFCLLLPLYCMTGHFYTDTMSMGLAIISMALMKIIHSRPLNTILKYVLIFFSALLIALSIFWKITSIIPFIAITIAFFLFNTKRNHSYCKLFAITLIFIIIIFTKIFNSYDIYIQSQKNCDPLLSWVALGLKGDGSWSDNREFVTYMHDNMLDTTEKMDYTIKYLKENWKYFFDKNHLIDKIRCNFSDGNLMTKQFTLPYDDNTVFWDIYNPWGAYFWRISQISFCYLQTIYISLLIGSIINMIHLFKHQNFDVLLFSTHLSFWGIFIFLMIWEACSRQLYNQMPMLILGCILAIKNTSTYILHITSHK